MWQQLQNDLLKGDEKALARSISFIENEAVGYEEFLQSLPVSHQTKIIGITGPPGAGKSTLVDGLIKEIVAQNNRVAVLCVDPSSPFNLGAVLGDRIRMSDWYTHPNVFIRSLATRGSMGGLHPKIIEITDLLQSANFDYIIIDTAPVGRVSDAFSLSSLIDSTIYLVRYNYTQKAHLDLIEDIYHNKKLMHPMIVLNDIKEDATHAYGYGYSYGYKKSDKKEEVSIS